ncbi:MAG: hypothetical protein FWE77_03025 [Clostridia bacterium]|nr:hypothetical protein [Clostridia bacterium]
MFQSIMEALYNGALTPGERPYASSPNRQALEDKMEHEKRYFMQKMSLDDCQRFQALDGLHAEAAFEHEAQVYSNGFALGTLLMIEVMERKEAMIKG